MNNYVTVLNLTAYYVSIALIAALSCFNTKYGALVMVICLFFLVVVIPKRKTSMKDNMVIKSVIKHGEVVGPMSKYLMLDVGDQPCRVFFSYTRSEGNAPILNRVPDELIEIARERENWLVSNNVRSRYRTIQVALLFLSLTVSTLMLDVGSSVPVFLVVGLIGGLVTLGVSNRYRFISERSYDDTICGDKEVADHVKFLTHCFENDLDPCRSYSRSIIDTLFPKYPTYLFRILYSKR